jgi:hypothetical protein
MTVLALIIVSAALENSRKRGKNCRSGFQPRHGRVKDSGAPRRGWKPLLRDGRNDDRARFSSFPHAFGEIPNPRHNWIAV